MLPITQNRLQTRSILRCVWIPVHIGANAPLTAVWIQALPISMKTEEIPANSVDEPEPWLHAA
jgi:hypothetical protein